MASVRFPIMRQLTSCPPRSPLRSSRVINQRRWAQVQNVRFLVTDQATQGVYDKYKNKLDQKAKQEGLGGISELKAAYAEKIDEQRRKSAVEDPVLTIPQAPKTPVYQPNKDPEPGSPQDPNTPPTSEPNKRPEIPQAPKTPVYQPNKDPEPASPQEKAARAVSSSAEKSAVKTLNDIIDLPKARELPDKELSAIWRLRHASSPQALCAVVPASTYRAMEEQAKKAPHFVLPVPHPEQGAEIHFLQWTFDAESKTSTVLFTQLAEFKTRGEFAQPHTTVTHHLDLVDERDLVLMQGQVVDGRGVKPDDAKWLVMCLQRFYGGWEGEGPDVSGERKARAEERQKLLEWFAVGDSRFSVDKLLEEAERMG